MLRLLSIDVFALMLLSRWLFFCPFDRLLPMSGCHVPPLCIGMEYAKTGNLQASDQFFAHTLSICAMDPLVFNEIGVLRYLQVQIVEEHPLPHISADHIHVHICIHFFDRLNECNAGKL